MAMSTLRGLAKECRAKEGRTIHGQNVSDNIANITAAVRLIGSFSIYRASQSSPRASQSSARASQS